MTIRGGLRRSKITYKIGGKVVSPITFAKKTGAKIYTSGGGVTALGRDVGAELSKGKVVIINKGTPKERIFIGTGKPEKLTRTPTKTEQTLRMSLPSNIRNLPVNKVRELIQQKKPKLTLETPKKSDYSQYQSKDKGIEKITKKQSIYTKIVPGLHVGVGGGIPGTNYQWGFGRTIQFNEITKTLFKALEKKGLSKEKIASISTLSPEQIDKIFKNRSERDRRILKSLSKFSKGLILGSLKSIEEEPEKMIVIGGVSYLLPGALAKAGASVKSIKFFNNLINKVPAPVRAKGSQAVSKFLGGAYIASTGLTIARQEGAQARGEKAGEILTTEIIPFSIGTKYGVQGFLRNEIKKEIRTELNKLSPNKRAAFEEYLKQAELLGKYEPEARNIRLDNIESIKSKKAQDVIRNFLKNNKNEVVVGGSVAQTGQINVKRKLGDMDLYLEGKLNPKQAAKQLADKLNKAGVKRVSYTKYQVTIEGKKVAEFHEIDRLLQNIEQVIPNWQSARKYIIRTPEGIKIQRLSLQARRKLVAAFLDPKRLATGKYTKDLKDFKVISDKLFRRAELKARGSYFFRESKIKKLEKIFGKKISRKLIGPVKPKKIKSKKVKIKPKIKKRKFTDEELKKFRIETLKKARAVRKAKLKKKLTPSQIKAKKIKAKKLIPSQKRVRRIKPKKLIPSQRGAKRKKIAPYPISKRKTTGYPIPKKSTIAPYPAPKKRKKTTKPPLLELSKRKIKKLKKPTQAYDIYEKRGIQRRKGKLLKSKEIKINKYPLTLKDAKDLLIYRGDNKISRTLKIKSVGKTKTLGSIPKQAKGYYAKNKNKFRKYRVKKVPLQLKYIEKKMYGIDTKGEKEQLRLNLLKKAQKRRVTVRKTSFSQPKRKLNAIQLENLRKGREKLAKLRKKRV